MPVKSIITTAEDVFFGGSDLTSLSFKNGSAAGILYIRNKQQTGEEVTSTNYEISLRPSEAFGVTLVNDGDGIIGPWRAISDTVGGVNLEILPIYLKGKRLR